MLVVLVMDMSSENIKFGLAILTMAITVPNKAASSLHVSARNSVLPCFVNLCPVAHVYVLS